MSAQTMSLAYLVFEVSRLPAWQEFATGILGCRPAATAGGEAAAFRIDDAAYRLLLRQGRRDDLAVLGWQLADEAALRALLGRLEGAGSAVRPFTTEECRVRGVAAGLRFSDPLGIDNEAVIGLQQAAEAFTSKVMPGGFHAGDRGLGHAVLAVGRRLAETEAFYTGLLGLRLTERIDTKVGPIKVDGAFLHCNPRHHSLALIAVPSRRRLLHFMLQANRMRDVGMALERTKAAGIPFSLELGQHPDPDGTVSFYAATPSGFDFEIGAGSGEIDPASHVTEIKTRTSDWGHRPSLRMQLRGAIDLLVDKFGRRAA